MVLLRQRQTLRRCGVDATCRVCCVRVRMSTVVDSAVKQSRELLTSTRSVQLGGNVTFAAHLPFVIVVNNIAPIATHGQLAMITVRTDRVHRPSRCRCEVSMSIARRYADQSKVDFRTQCMVGQMLQLKKYNTRITSDSAVR